MIFGNLNVSAIAGTPVYDTSTNSKLEPNLADKLAKMDDDDEIDVPIWVQDVDHEKVEGETREQILSMAGKGEVKSLLYGPLPGNGKQSFIHTLSYSYSLSVYSYRHHTLR